MASTQRAEMRMPVNHVGYESPGSFRSILQFRNLPPLFISIILLMPMGMEQIKEIKWVLKLTMSLIERQ